MGLFNAKIVHNVALYVIASWLVHQTLQRDITMESLKIKTVIRIFSQLFVPAAALGGMKEKRKRGSTMGGGG